ncbi:MAG: hypothetical protein WBA54_02405 [Acidaminobacteraceae bacterium]
MSKYIKIFLIGVLSATIFSGCNTTEDTKISTIDDNSKEVVVVNINDNENLKNINSYFLDEKTDDYDFLFETLESDKYIIQYPVLTNYKGELSMEYINQSIKAHAMDLVSNTSDVAEGIQLTYTSEVISQNDNFISIKFTGELPYEGSAYKLMSGLIIDLNSTNTITSENLFTEDTTLLNQEFEKTAKLLDTTSFSPAGYMIMYIQDTSIVFAYMENDMATEFTEIKLPLESIIDNLNIDFGEMPAS